MLNAAQLVAQPPIADGQLAEELPHRSRLPPVALACRLVALAVVRRAGRRWWLKPSQRALHFRFFFYWVLLVPFNIFDLFQA